MIGRNRQARRASKIASGDGGQTSGQVDSGSVQQKRSFRGSIAWFFSILCGQCFGGRGHVRKQPHEEACDKQTCQVQARVDTQPCRTAKHKQKSGAVHKSSCRCNVGQHGGVAQDASSAPLHSTSHSVVAAAAGPTQEDTKALSLPAQNSSALDPQVEVDPPTVPSSPGKYYSPVILVDATTDDVELELLEVYIPSW